MNTDEFYKFCEESCVENFEMPIARIAWQAATSSTAAKYQAMVKELEEAIKENVRRSGFADMLEPWAALVLRNTSPDKALQRVVLEAELKGAIKAQASGDNSFHYVEKLRAELAALNLEGE